MERFDINDYNYLRISACSPKCKLMDIDYNLSQIIEEIHKAIENDVQIISFPQLALTGNTSADLLKHSIIREKIDKAIKQLCEMSKIHSLCIIVGALVHHNYEIYNSAIVMDNGVVRAIIPEESVDYKLIPQIFNRTNVPFGNNIIFSYKHFQRPELAKFAVVVGEDAKKPIPFSSFASLAGADVIFNLGYQIETVEASDTWHLPILEQAKRINSAFVYASSGFGESSTDYILKGKTIIYEVDRVLDTEFGLENASHSSLADIDIDLIRNTKLNSTIYNSNLTMEFNEIPINANNSCFDDKLCRIVRQYPFQHIAKNKAKYILDMQSVALERRLRHINCSNIVLGLSGGLDSTLALLVAVNTFRQMGLDYKGIHCISMPGFGTTNRTKSNAELLANAFGTTLRLIPIDKAVNQHFADIGHKPEDTNIVYENSQARERTQILMDISNQVNGIVLGTGDLSEIALGWSTYNGDHISMYNVNCGVPKTLVRYIIEQLASKDIYPEEIRNILLDIVNTPISPELLPLDEEGKLQQKTEDSVGSYVLNDFLLYNFVKHYYSPKKLYLLACIAFEDEFNDEYIKDTIRKFFRRFFNAQFKRSCSPDGPQICEISLSPRASSLAMPTDASAIIWIEEAENL